MSNKEFDYLSRKAEILKTIAHPVRLSILRDIIKNGEKTAGDLETVVKLPPASVSQHLTRMSQIGIFKRRRHGTYIYYSLIDDDNIVELIKAYL